METHPDLTVSLDLLHVLRTAIKTLLHEGYPSPDLLYEHPLSYWNIAIQLRPASSSEQEKNSSSTCWQHYWEQLVGEGMRKRQKEDGGGTRETEIIIKSCLRLKPSSYL